MLSVAALAPAGASAVSKPDTDTDTCSFNGLAGALDPNVNPVSAGPNIGDYRFSGAGTCVVIDHSGDSDGVTQVLQPTISSFGDYINEVCGTGYATGDYRSAATEGTGAVDGDNVEAAGTKAYFTANPPAPTGWNSTTGLYASPDGTIAEAGTTITDGISSESVTSVNNTPYVPLYDIAFTGGSGPLTINPNNPGFDPPVFGDGDQDQFNSGSGVVNIVPLHTNSDGSPGSPDPSQCNSTTGGVGSVTYGVRYFQVNGSFTATDVPPGG